GARAPLPGVVEEPGQGVQGSLDGIDLRLGRPSFCGADGAGAALAAADRQASAIAFACGDRRFVFAVRQRLREDAAAVVAALRHRGLALEILSGDRAD